MLETIQVSTPRHSAMVDVTDLVARKIRDARVESGVCVIYVSHTSAGITINEGADPAVVDDVLTSLDQLVPWRANYKHMEGNSAAHIKTSLMGSSAHVIVDGGKPMLGTWQRIFLCEFDGPRTRKIRIKILAD